jgi:hypothetical protein
MFARGPTRALSNRPERATPLPACVGCGGDLTVDRVYHELEQAVLRRRVRVEPHRPRLQLGRNLPQRQRSEAIAVGDHDRRLDDPLAREGYGSATARRLWAVPHEGGSGDGQFLAGGHRPSLVLRARRVDNTEY